MAIEEYVGAIVVEVDGREFECLELSENIQTGRKLVKTMNRTGRAKGYAQGVAEYQLRVRVVVPLDGDVAWEDAVGVRVTQYPVSGSGGQRVSYLDCFVTSAGSTYTVDSEAVRDIEIQALRKVIE